MEESSDCWLRCDPNLIPSASSLFRSTSECEALLGWKRGPTRDLAALALSYFSGGSVSDLEVPARGTFHKPCTAESRQS